MVEDKLMGALIFVMKKLEREIGEETRVERSRESAETCYSPTFVNTLYRHF
jgi:hypothetical protein